MANESIHQINNLPRELIIKIFDYCDYNVLSKIKCIEDILDEVIINNINKNVLSFLNNNMNLYLNSKYTELINKNILILATKYANIFMDMITKHGLTFFDKDSDFFHSIKIYCEYSNKFKDDVGISSISNKPIDNPTFYTGYGRNLGNYIEYDKTNIINTLYELMLNNIGYIVNIKLIRAYVAPDPITNKLNPTEVLLKLF